MSTLQDRLASVAIVVFFMTKVSSFDNNFTTLASDSTDCGRWCECIIYNTEVHIKCHGSLPHLKPYLKDVTSLILLNPADKYIYYNSGRKRFKEVFDLTPNLRELVMDYFFISHLSEETFSNLRKLEILDLRNHKQLKKIDSNFFRTFTNLKKIRFANVPYLDLQELQQSFHSIRSDKIDTLVVQSTDLTTRLSNDFFSPFQKSNLKTVVLSNVGTLDVKVILGLAMHNNSLSCIMMSGNSYIKTFYDKPEFPNLRLLDFTGVAEFTELKEICSEPLPVSTEVKHVNQEWTKKEHYMKCEFVIEVPANLRYISFTDAKPLAYLFGLSLNMLGYSRGDICVISNAVRYVDMHGYEFPTKHNIYGLLRLQYFNIQSTETDKLHCGTLCNMPSLTTLLAGQNRLGPSFEIGNATFAIRNLTHLSSLDLAACEIYTISLSDFQTISQIKFVNLSSNKITTDMLNHTVDFRITFLNLSDNNIKYLPINFTNSFDNAIRKFKNKTAKAASNLQFNISNFPLPVIDMSRNRFVCTCDSLPFLEWFKTHHQHFYRSTNYSCKFQSSDESLIYFNMSKIINCDPHIPVPKILRDPHQFPITAISCTIAVMIVITLITILSIRYKRQLKYYLHFLPYIKIKALIYKRNLRYEELDEENPDKYDAFILCSGNDLNFILQNIKPELIARGFTIILGEEDFMPGTLITKEIEKALVSSTCALLILTTNFIQSGWLDYEVTLAVAMKCRVIIVKVDDIPHRLMPPALIYLYNRHETRPRYPKNRAENLPTFWDNLSAAITRMKTDRF